jgi:molybdate transport system ATP-binding protein
VLRASFARRLGGFDLEIDLEVADRATLVLVGESGSGKTTILNLLAGTLRPDHGRIEVDREVWHDATAGVDLPADRRPVGYVFQDYALFPHLDVFENVAFGLRASRVAAADVRRRVGAALERLGIGHLAARRPDQVSGGQRQRVAIARALVLEPRLLLLDEPLSALDVQTRRAMRSELRRLLAELPCSTIVVTHSPVEAMAFGETITVIEAGRTAQSGGRDELLRRPRSPYVAELFGINLVRGTVAPGPEPGLARLAGPGGAITIVDEGSKGDEVLALVHPREITLSRERPYGSAQNVLAGTIEEIVPEPPLGERMRVSLATTPPLVAEVARSSVERLDLAPGVPVHASFKATAVVTYR